MKHALIILMMALPVTFLQAQTEKGTILLGTSTKLTGTSVGLYSCPNAVGIGFVSSKTKSDDFESDAESSTMINLVPNAGIFVADNILVGAELTFEYLKYEEDDDPFTVLGFGPFVRYYLDQGGFKPYAQVSFGIGQWSYGSDDDDKMNLMDIGGAIGASLFVGDRTSVDVFLGYNHNEFKEKDASNNFKQINNSFGVGVGLSVFI